MANPYQPQGDKTDYLMSVLCVIKVLDVLTLPLTAIVGIFWVKKYQLPMMGEGFSTKINAKKSCKFCCSQFPVRRLDCAQSWEKMYFPCRHRSRTIQ